MSTIFVDYMKAQQISSVENITKDSKNPLYPIFLKLDTLELLLVGAGNVGLEKLNSLLGNTPNAHITIVAPFVREEIYQRIKEHSNCTILERPFENEDMEGKDLIILATDQPSLHKEIRELAKEKKILINVADTPDLCDFYLGSIVQKGSLKIAISTNGQSPTAAKRIKEVLNETLPAELDEVITKLHKVRSRMTGSFDQKVKKLNAITDVLVENDQNINEKKWKRRATYLILAFACMVIGHIIFSYLPLKTMAVDAVAFYHTLEPQFPIMLLAGFIAQLVDGALGMGYGVTSATILMSAGVSPAAISGSIHTAETFASGVSGYSHYKFGNVNKKLFKALVIPGVLGAIAGALLLVYWGEKYGKFIRPFIAIYTLILGIKFIFNAFRNSKASEKFKHYSILAAVGGFFDSFGGGGWGPIVTSTLINKGRSHKYAVGTVSLTEFFVTIASAFTFFTMLGMSHWQTIVALIIGGTLAAPIAARLAGKLPKKTAFLLLGALVIFWSLKILIKIF